MVIFKTFYKKSSLTDIPFTEQRFGIKGILIDELERKVFISPQVCCCFREKSSEDSPGLCALLLALLMTQCLCDFYQKPEREKELKCFLLKTLMYVM